MSYGKLIDGQLVYAPLNLVTDGHNILNYVLEVNDTQLRADGYKPVVMIADKGQYHDCDGAFGFEFKDEGDHLQETAVFYKYDDDEKARRVRDDRNAKLDSTDKIVSAPDYPISAEEKEKVLAYRQYLREIPQSEGFPWVKVKTFEEWSN